MRASIELQKGRIQKAAQLWHKVGLLHQEVVTKSQQTSKPTDVARGIKQIESVPEIRADRVTELRARIQSGTYIINSTAIAEKMLCV